MRIFRKQAFEFKTGPGRSPPPSFATRSEKVKEIENSSKLELWRYFIKS